MESMVHINGSRFFFARGHPIFFLLIMDSLKNFRFSLLPIWFVLSNPSPPYCLSSVVIFVATIHNPRAMTDLGNSVWKKFEKTDRRTPRGTAERLVEPLRFSCFLELTMMTSWQFIQIRSICLREHKLMGRLSAASSTSQNSREEDPDLKTLQLARN